ncbi:MAG: toll/interleukin-1 receptor domain-containing protein [Synergistaceae bacterium]|nr:toll/interleukin-1 receptor domain-containing protein [Synergistaceae bacterium]
MEYEFSAFVSYKRGGDDEKTARAIQRRLERYRVPTADLPAEARPDGAAAGGLPARLKVFRDKSDLGSHANLSEGLSENLDVSRFLIVICSERSAQSPYVDGEVRHFVESGRSGDIIPLIIGGGQPMPPSMPECAEPITDPGKEEVFIRVLSRILRVDYDNLWVAHLRARRRSAFRWFSLAACLSVVTASLALWAFSAAHRATAARLEAEELVEFLIYDVTKAAVLYLPDFKMELVAGKAREYYETWAPGEPKTLRAAANNRDALAYSALAAGDYGSALEMMTQSAEIFAALCGKEPQNKLYLADYSDALAGIGNFSGMLGQTEKAEENYKKSVETARRIDALPSDPLPLKTTLASKLMSLADFLSSAGRFGEADVLFDECAGIWDGILKSQEGEADIRTARMGHAELLSRRAESISKRGDYRGALELYVQSASICEELHREDPKNLIYRTPYIGGLIGAMNASMNVGDLQRAAMFYEEAEKQLRYLSEYHARPSYTYMYSVLLVTGGILRSIQGEQEEALGLLNEAESLLDGLLRDDPENGSYTALKTQLESLRE